MTPPLVVILYLVAGVGAFFAIIYGIAYVIFRASGKAQPKKSAIWAGATLAPLVVAASGFGLNFLMQGSSRLIVHNEEAMVTASRGFAGPTQYPPEDFAAYGILAFQSRASSHNRSRHLMICKAYVSNLPHTSELEIPATEQMVTVWPMESDSAAHFLNARPRRSDSCEIAVDNYGLVVAKQALKEAELAGVDTTDSGPLLLAWSPSTDKGNRDALVLVSDLSDITTYEQADGRFRKWSREIESDPKLWANGWDVERLRETIRNWIDANGTKALALFGYKG